MDLRMWGFITFPKESTASACPSLVSQRMDVLHIREMEKYQRMVLKAFFSTSVLLASSYEFWL